MNTRNATYIKQTDSHHSVYRVPENCIPDEERLDLGSLVGLYYDLWLYSAPLSFNNCVVRWQARFTLDGGGGRGGGGVRGGGSGRSSKEDHSNPKTPPRN